MRKQLFKTNPLLDQCFYIIGWVCIGLAVLGLIAVKLGALQMLGGIPPCALHRLTGYYCPGCGGTRAVVALFHGKILTSLYYHPIVVYTAAMGGWFMFSQTVEHLSKGKIKIGLHYRDIYLWIALCLVVLNCLAKNLILAITGIPPMA